MLRALEASGGHTDGDHITIGPGWLLPGTYIRMNDDPVLLERLSQAPTTDIEQYCEVRLMFCM